MTTTRAPRAKHPPSAAGPTPKWLLWNLVIVAPIVTVLWFFSVIVIVLPFGISILVDIALIGWTVYLMRRVGPVSQDGKGA